MIGFPNAGLPRKLSPTNNQRNNGTIEDNRPLASTVLQFGHTKGLIALGLRIPHCKRLSVCGETIVFRMTLCFGKDRSYLRVWTRTKLRHEGADFSLYRLVPRGTLRAGYPPEPGVVIFNDTLETRKLARATLCTAISSQRVQLRRNF